ncbi:MAG: oligosaccharide flippase family protein [Flavobacteriaceae bacterium]|nr:oligosaccharide flippase family protein [Flavobacteriaceae bacterium]
MPDLASQQREQKAYRNILKVTSIFGGEQLVQMVVAVVRSKFLAIWLGPLGMGINSLLQTTLSLAEQFFSMGLHQSAVRDIAEAKNKNAEKLAIIIAVLIKWAWKSALVGGLFILFFSFGFSIWIFGDSGYTLAFVLIGIAVFLKIITTARLAVLQGLQRYSSLAKVRILGSMVSLLAILPIYYVWREAAIAPAILIATSVLFLVTLFFYKDIPKRSEKLNKGEFLQTGKKMMRLGFVMSLGGFLNMASLYAVQLFIQDSGSLSDVGLFSAGFTIIHVYFGMVFNAMTTDYYPRLAATDQSPNLLKNEVNRQAVFSLLITTPLILIILIFGKGLITLLYAASFEQVYYFLFAALLGVTFKSISFCFGFIFIAKGDVAVYGKTLIIFNLLFFALMVTGYMLGDLRGLGIAFSFYYFIHLTVVVTISKLRYQLGFSGELLKIITISLILVLASMLLTYFDTIFFTSLKVLLLVVSLLFSLYYLNQKTHIFEMLKKIIKRLGQHL